MSVVVMEVCGDQAVVMNDAGEFSKIRNRNYRSGQRIETGAVRPAGRFLRRSLVAAAASLLLAAGGIYAYCAPYTRVNFDVNPSIELNMNIFDMVVGANALNGDAQGILEQLRLFNTSLNDAANQIVTELANQGYLAPGGESDIMITTTSQDRTKSQEILRTAVQTVEAKTTELQLNTTVLGECAANEVAERARALGVGPGKLMLAEQYANSTGNPDQVNVGEWLKKPVREIVAAIRSNGETPVGMGAGYNGGDKSANGYSGGDKSDNGYNNGDGNGNGYNGGDKSANGYSGGDKSANGQNGPTPAPSASATPAANGYSGGDHSGNGYNGGDRNGTPSPSASPQPQATQTGNSASPAPTATPAGNGNGQNGNRGATACQSPCPTCSQCSTCSPCPTCTGTGDQNQNRNGQGK